MHRFLRFAFVLAVSLFLVATGSPAQAGFGNLKDKLKDKAQQKVEKTVEQKVDRSSENAPEKEPAGETGKDAESPGAASGTAAGGATAEAGKAGGTATAEDMALYTKYDFVPGDKVLFYDDLSKDEIGEFPSRWKLDHGVFEVAKQHGQAWIYCSDKGVISPKVAPGLPEKYTVEMDFYANATNDGWIHIFWVNDKDEEIGKLYLAYDNMTGLEILGKRLADKELTRLAAGRHTLRIMATKTTIKCYLDQERIANVPAVDGFNPVGLTVAVDPYGQDWGPMLIGAFRLAEGGKSLRQQLDEDGRIVTHGILFDSGSDRIKAESYKTLADIGQLLTEGQDLKVSIEGHTDSDGADEANLTLSQKRADAVRSYLAQTYQIAPERMQTKGWGEGKPIQPNDTPEGKAMNRRVELVKV